jgi:hypothetical protein
MGVLDDAIRDHLDLKRRHGAEPEEIERAEREALGPVRRGPDEGEALAADFDEPFAYDQNEEAGWEEAPARESAGPAPAAAGEQDEQDEQEGVFDHAAELDEAPTTIQRPAQRPQAEPAEEPPREEKPFAEDDPFAEEEPFPEEEEHLPEEEEPFPDERSSPAPPPHAAPGTAPPEPTGDETAEYNVEEALREPGHKDEDVLEETPDFLQDAPDHDRLWFEQRPPKDFDFNG